MATGFRRRKTEFKPVEHHLKNWPACLEVLVNTYRWFGFRVIPFPRLVSVLSISIYVKKITINTYITILVQSTEDTCRIKEVPVV